MMKNKQKKLKAKHFRYLSKEQVKDPKAYIRQSYEKYDLSLWQEDAYVFLTSGSVSFRPPPWNSFDASRRAE